MLERIAGRLFGTPLAVEPGYLDGVLQAVGSKVLGAGPIKGEAAEEPERAKPSLSNGEGGAIAVIPLHNALVQRAGRLDMASSGEMESYARFGANFAAALESPKVSGIVLDVDSPGGEVAGLFELAEGMLKARGTKPVFAVANELSASAAYAITATADRIYAPATAMVGSIGVVLAHVNQAKMDEKLGLEWTFIQAGKEKTDGNPHEPLSDEARARAQKRVNAVGEMFLGFVSRARGEKLEVKMVKEAQVLRGQEALDAGLVDQIGGMGPAISDMRALLAQKEGSEVAGEEGTASGGGLNLSVPAAAPPIDMDALGTAVSAAVVQAMAETRKAEAEAAAAVKAAEDERKVMITALGKKTHLESLAGELIAQGANVEEAREKLMEAMAAGQVDDIKSGDVGSADPWAMAHKVVFGESTHADGRREGMRRVANGLPLRAY